MTKFNDAKWRRNLLNEGLKKSDLAPVIKIIQKVEKLIKKADDELYAARSYVYQKLEDKAGDDYNDPKSVERAIYNLKDSISLGMREMLKDPLKQARKILGDINNIAKKL